MTGWAIIFLWYYPNQNNLNKPNIDDEKNTPLFINEQFITFLCTK
ncbi:hypothetical protein SAMN04488522_104831 [Pedobacter caeni]|uniref:Uncharacterized protein n=1 Tax=Pedobacter caeni TaxID=288992 RepID=A0A1M5HVA4_9SPHI|nr:hypothetical protein SAMN04488522_104831 [Pedobacter caeni]